MKRFVFSLERVQQFKEQMLENLKTEHGAILVEIAQQETLIDTLQNRQKDVNEELNQKYAVGITPVEMNGYKVYFRTLENQILGERKKLEELHCQEEAKRLEIVEMKKDTASLEKLRERKQREYEEEVKKKDEAFVEEFVSNQRLSRG